MYQGKVVFYVIRSLISLGFGLLVGQNKIFKDFGLYNAKMVKKKKKVPMINQLIEK